MQRVKQQFGGPQLPDVAASVQETLATLAPAIQPGQSVALTVGSRGVVNIDTIVRATVQYLQSLGAEPFIIPAMGSHGGGTAEGQAAVLAHYGVSEGTMGCPVKSTMEVVQIGEVLGLPIWLDSYAAEADWIGVINRVKPHTGFTGEIGSGHVQDDDHRHGQAPRRGAGAPRQHQAGLRVDDHGVGQGNGARARASPSGSASSRTATTRPLSSRPSRRGTSRRANASCCAGPRRGWPSCPSTPSIC